MCRLVWRGGAHLRLADQCADRLLTVAAGAAKVVEQLLEELRGAKLDDTANVLMIDAHPEGIVCHHHAEMPLNKLQLGALAVTDALLLVRSLTLEELAVWLVIAPLQRRAAVVAAHSDDLRRLHTALCDAEHRLKLRADGLHLADPMCVDDGRLRAQRRQRLGGQILHQLLKLIHQGAAKCPARLGLDLDLEHKIWPVDGALRVDCIRRDP